MCVQIKRMIGKIPSHVSALYCDVYALRFMCRLKAELYNVRGCSSDCSTH